ncbi:hypothetical protein J6590_007055 [Homalodisca vitripennis]|nr:hypothetical protein J6590_007055 [Homalodisca vitripennis]
MAARRVGSADVSKAGPGAFRYGSDIYHFTGSIPSRLIDSWQPLCVQSELTPPGSPCLVRRLSDVRVERLSAACRPSPVILLAAAPPRSFLRVRLVLEKNVKP